ncbi:hypothetical protein AV530_013890 [Patagioenas fasciata monilis]|uniref:Uncharacterized protein n=1 Tax=Patagioenas fasciata monilis TaxID=372326 RepID=A0A1V4KMZ0_PATFA|nr:hypothetical protein AV530_013890 [Patagioenas fasciata monilis]
MALILPVPQSRMVDTHLRAKTAALAVGSAPSTPVVADASMQMELLKGETAEQISDCRKCLDCSPGGERGGRSACKRCAQVEDLLQHMAELQEVVGRLHNNRKVEKELDSWFQAQSAVNPLYMAKKPKPLPPAHRDVKGANNVEKWKLTMAKISRRKKLSLKHELHLQNGLHRSAN